MIARKMLGARLRQCGIAIFLAMMLGMSSQVAAHNLPRLDSIIGQGLGERESVSTSLQIILLMSVLTILPSILLMMTSFTRIIIVLSILRQALGLQQTPPNQVLVGLALFLSIFVMRPVFEDMNQNAYAPYTRGAISIERAVEKSGIAIHRFMIAQTRDKDLAMFADMADAGTFSEPADVPFSILLPAFVTSELKTAFIIGFLIYLPFLVIDLVVASTMTAMGMVMLSPSIISLPFKLLLFILVDGWALTMGSLASSFAASSFAASSFAGG
ncbi:MAG: flagellar type III secretion system pore protein FliP [Sphingopyxis sp.]